MRILKYIYSIWMKIAYLLCWFNTRLILLVLYFLIFMPVGLVMRLFAVDLLDRRIEKNRGSYWLKKEDKEFKPYFYERRF